MSYSKSILVILMLSISIFSSCHQDDDDIQPGNNTSSTNTNTNTTDLRDTVVGKYQVVQEIQCYCGTVGPQCHTFKDTVISVDYGSNNSTITLLNRTITFNATGVYSLSPNYLYLKEDSIYSYYINGGHGCGQYEKYYGHKISDQP